MEDQLQILNEKLSNSSSLEERLEIQQQIFDLKVNSGQISISNDTIECIGCGS